MAASWWYETLKAHDLWGKIKCDEENNSVKLKNIVQIQDDFLYAWNSDNQTLLTLNLTGLYGLSERQKIKEVQQLQMNCQKLLLTTPPKFEITNLCFNLTGCMLCLNGKRGAVIAQVPKRWGADGNFEGGKEIITVRSKLVAESFFLSNHNLQILHVAWHPASPTDLHLVLLTSDSYIRIYSAYDPLTPEQAVSLGTSPLSTRSCLGETAVSFDFGSPEEAGDDIIWPLFVLFENGEVYCTYMELHASLDRKKTKILGPLPMHPAADDNYGIDACSIVCLKNSPAVLAIATASGHIHHCIVLTDQDSSEKSCLSEEEMVLYVYESVEMELSLLAEPYDVSAIKLHHDPFTSSKYYACHNAGVHAVTVPFISQLGDFVQDEACEVPSETPCIVEHLLCTQPVSQESNRAVIGLTFVTSPTLGFSLLVTVSPAFPITIPLTIHYQPQPQKLLADTSSSSPFIKTQKPELEQRLQEILKKNMTQPLLAAGDDISPSPQQCLQLLTRATESLREHILRLGTARDEIAKRVRILTTQKNHQMTEIAELKKQRQSLLKKEQSIESRYKILQETQQGIISRLESVLQAIQKQSPVISDAEKNMKKELADIQEEIPKLKVTTEQLKVRQEYQHQQFSGAISESEEYKGTGLSDGQTRHLHDLLAKEGEDIAELTKKLCYLKGCLSV